MCLAVPMEITAIDDMVATVNVGSVTKQVRLDVMPEEVAIGDYVINHAGFAIRKLDPQEAEETLKLFQEGFNIDFSEIS